MNGDELAKRMTFTAEVAAILREKVSPTHVEISEPLHLLLGDKDLGLEDLYRAVSLEGPRGRPYIIKRFIEVFSTCNAMKSSARPRSFESLREHIMPRVQPITMFDRVDKSKVVHSPFVNDCVISYVEDEVASTTSLLWSEVKTWGLRNPLETLDEIARYNLKKITRTIRITQTQYNDENPYICFDGGDGYDAARLLLPNLHKRLAGHFGGDFYVAVPCRDAFLAFSMGEEYKTFAQEILPELFSTQPYPLTLDLFIVTQDGIAGTMKEEISYDS